MKDCNKSDLYTGAAGASIGYMLIALVFPDRQFSAGYFIFIAMIYLALSFFYFCKDKKVS